MFYMFSMEASLKYLIEKTQHCTPQSSEDPCLIFLHSVVNNASDLIVAVDYDYKFMLVNQQFKNYCLETLNTTPEVGEHVCQFYNNLGLDEVTETRLLHLWTRLVDEDYEVTYKSKIDERVYSLKSSRITNTNSMPLGALIIIRDITRLSEKEEELARTLQQNQLLIKATSPVTWQTNAAGAFEVPQTDWEAYTGHTFKEYKAYGWIKSLHPDDRDRMLNNWLVSIQTGAPHVDSGSIWHQQTNAYRHFRVQGVPIVDDQQNISGWIGCIIDVHELVEKQQMLENALLQLEDTNKELEKFAYIASHDLQEPLRMVSSYLQLIEKRYEKKLDEKGLSFMHYAIDGANRMKDLIQDLLSYSRVAYKEHLFKQVDLNKVLILIQEQYQRLIREKNARLRVEVLPVVNAIPLQMQQLFQNLIANSIKFCPQGSQPHIHISVTDELTHWQFCVEDNGIGIPEEYAEKVFEIFQRLNGREEYEGSGIGLSICKKIVKNHQGNIWFNSIPGQGTSFYFTIKKTNDADTTN